MKREWRDKWADWCEDPSSIQTVGALEHVDEDLQVTGRCCLGGLCYLVSLEHPDKVTRVVSPHTSQVCYNNEGGLLPEAVAEIVGGCVPEYKTFRDSEADRYTVQLTTPEGTEMLAQLANDRYRYTLPQIGAMIRQLPVED